MDVTQSICHGCKYGAKPGDLTQCNFPNLKAGAILPRTRKVIDALHIAGRIAEGKGIKGFDALPFVAVVRATESDKCRYFEK